MGTSLRRLAAIIRKEVLHIVRDPRNLFLVTVSPAFLLFLLAYIFSYEISQLRLAVIDLDRSLLSRRYVAALTKDQDFILTHTLDRYGEIEPLLVGGQIDAALVIPPGFASTIYGGHPAQVQAIIDGSDAFAGSQAIASLEAKSAQFVAGEGTGGISVAAPPVQVHTQARYNAGLKSQVSMVPGLLAIVLLMPTMALALALTREKESGTLEGLVATPVLAFEYLIGKLLAYIGMGLVSAFLALLVAVLWFKVPFRGSLAVYLLLTADYFLACMGATVLVANFVKSQQTALFIVLLVFVVPSFFLAGLITPISTESLGSRLTSLVLPSTHFVEISRAVFLKGLGLATLARPALVLLGMGVGAIVLGLLFFKKKVV
jgi:ABC-2 type transport system permease protein